MVMRRRGFTLIEMMLATVVTAVLSVSLATLFVGIRRLVRQAYDDASLSLALRAEREWALFNAVAEGGSVHWGGLLSAKDTQLPGDDAVAFTATGVQTESGAPLARVQQRWTRAAAAGVLEKPGAETADVRALLADFGVPFSFVARFSPDGRFLEGVRRGVADGRPVPSSRSTSAASRPRRARSTPPSASRSRGSPPASRTT